MVYNISAYMDFHPGGEEELMKAAGIDGTDLFDQVNNKFIRWDDKHKPHLVLCTVLCCDKLLELQIVYSICESSSSSACTKLTTIQQ